LVIFGKPCFLPNLESFYIEDLSGKFLIATQKSNLIEKTPVASRFERLLPPASAHFRPLYISLETASKPKLPSYLRTLAVRPGYLNVVSLGITRDADDSAQSAFQSVCSSLNRASLPVPSKPGEIVGDSPQVSIMILPDGQNSGMLEDLFLTAIETDPVLPCVDEYFDCVYRTSGRKPNNMAKARVHTWLASQLEPDKRLGEAAKAGYLPWDSPGFDSLKQFLEAL
jgi:hypothetical protein